jgi:hypothetical protein
VVGGLIVVGTKFLLTATDPAGDRELYVGGLLP